MAIKTEWNKSNQNESTYSIERNLNIITMSVFVFLVD